MRLHKLTKLLDQQELALVLNLALNALMKDEEENIAREKKLMAERKYSMQDRAPRGIEKHMHSFAGGWTEGDAHRNKMNLVDKLMPIVELSTVSEQFSYQQIEEEE